MKSILAKILILGPIFLSLWFLFLPATVRAGTVTTGLLPAFNAGNISIVGGEVVSVPGNYADNGTGPLLVSYAAPTSIVFEMAHKDGGAALVETIDIEPLFDSTGGLRYVLDLGAYCQVTLQNPSSLHSVIDTPSRLANLLARQLNSSGVSVTPGAPSSSDSTPDSSSGSSSSFPPDDSSDSSLPGPELPAPRPFLTTPLNDYSVTEGLLLVLLILTGLAAVLALFRGR